MVFARSLAAAAMLAAGFVAPGMAQERDLAQEEANRALVVEFYEQVFQRHDVAGAVEVMAEDYIQHNPHVPNGKAPFVDYFTAFFAENPEARSEIKRSAANGDLVWLHVHATNGEDDRGRAVLDILRVEDGMIVEHWDVIQPVPETAANDNTMF